MNNVEIEGLENAKAQILALAAGMEKAGAQALNAAAREAKTRLLEPLLNSKAGLLDKTLIARRLFINTATASRLESGVKSGSWGITVPAYRYTLKRSAVPTRAQVMIQWVNGLKVAAGFINPRGARQAPLRTRSQRGQYIYPTQRPVTALGPSAAAIFKVVVNEQIKQQAAELLTQKVLEAQARYLGAAL